MTALVILNAIKLGSTVSAAICWFVSSRVTLIKPGMGELDKVTLLASDLQAMGKWNCGAAAFACVAAAAEAIGLIL